MIIHDSFKEQIYNVILRAQVSYLLRVIELIFQNVVIVPYNDVDSLCATFILTVSSFFYFDVNFKFSDFLTQTKSCTVSFRWTIGNSWRSYSRNTSKRITSFCWIAEAIDQLLSSSFRLRYVIWRIKSIFPFLDLCLHFWCASPVSFGQCLWKRQDTNCVRRGWDQRLEFAADIWDFWGREHWFWQRGRWRKRRESGSCWNYGTHTKSIAQEEEEECVAWQARTDSLEIQSQIVHFDACK